MFKINDFATPDYYKKPEYKDVEDYYTGGFWKGLGSEKLQMFGQSMQKGEMELLEAGNHPKTEEKICKKNKGEFAFIDCTFSSPKYFSAVYFLDTFLGEKAFEEDYQYAIDEAMGYFGSLAKARKNSKNDKADGIPGLIYVQVDHETARPTKEKDNRKITIRPDFQKHTHILLSNRVVCDDGHVRALYNKEMYFNQKVVGARFRKCLSRRLKLRGYEIEKCIDYEEKVRGNDTVKFKVNSFKIKGISEEQMLMFSNRKKEIDYLAFKYGTTSNKGRDRIAADFRSAKVQYNRDELIQIWKEDANKLGLTNDYLQSIKKYNSKSDLTYFKSDESILKYAIRNEVLYKRDILVKLHELGQFINIDVDKKFNQWVKEGKIVEIGNNKYRCTVDLKNTEKADRTIRNKINVNPAAFISNFNKENNVIEIKIKNNYDGQDIKIIDIESKKKADNSENVSFKVDAPIVDYSSTIEGMQASVGRLMSKLLNSKISPQQAARIRLQIESLNLQIIELRKKQLNSSPKI